MVVRCESAVRCLDAVFPDGGLREPPMSDERPTTLSPSELARLAGVSTDTLRHYERKRVLLKPARLANGYRRYPPEAVSRVQLVQRALRIGFSLDQLARVLAERHRGGAPCRSVRTLVAERLGELEKSLRDLTSLRRELRELLHEWDGRLAETPAGAQARLLDSLSGPIPSSHGRAKRLSSRRPS
jgi:DNA-binding transcriptional MerR regulator